jgi:hypothetical protein
MIAAATAPLTDRRWRARPIPILSQAERERFLALVNANTSREHGQCWTWKRRTTKKGYARAKFRGEQTFLHQVMNVCATGRPLGALDSVDHACRRRNCLRPDHLRRASIARNSSDNAQARKERCIRGHSLADAIRKKVIRTVTFADGSTTTRPRVMRRCRACNAARPWRERRAA